VSAAVYDITVPLGEGTVDYPGDTPFERTMLWRVSDGALCDLSRLVMSAHSGTHVDAPAHFMAGGRTIDQFPLERFMPPAVVVDVPYATEVDGIGPAVVESADLRPGDALVLRTANSTSGRCRSGSFSERFVHLTGAAARACVRRRVSLVGLDYASVERYGSEDFAAHRTLLGAEILILEGIRLDHVPAGRYRLHCLPLSLPGAEASPVRALLIAEVQP